MAGREAVVFHDFFGFVGTKREDEKCRINAAVTNSSKVSKNLLTLAEDTEQEIILSTAHNARQVKEIISPVILSGSVSLEHQTSEEIVSDQSIWTKENYNLLDKEKSIYTDRGHKQMNASHYKQLQTNTDSSNNFKMARTEKSNDRKRGYQEMTNEDLHLTMQPPRGLFKSSCSNSSSIPKMDVPAFVPKNWDVPSLGPQSMALFGPTRVVDQKNSLDEHMMRDSYMPISIPLQAGPADEGSRTGLKGSSIGNLVNSRSSNSAVENMGSAFVAKPKSRSQAIDMESSSTLLASHHMPLMTRQLTIFYGGQAHVFEDISSEKAEAIIELAGSNSRSWSTTYSPRSKSSVPLSASEGNEGKTSGVSERHTFLKSSINAQTISERTSNMSETDKELLK